MDIERNVTPRGLLGCIHRNPTLLLTNTYHSQIECSIKDAIIFMICCWMLFFFFFKKIKTFIIVLLMVARKLNLLKAMISLNLTCGYVACAFLPKYSSSWNDRFQTSKGGIVIWVLIAICDGLLKLFFSSFILWLIYVFF